MRPVSKKTVHPFLPLLILSFAFSSTNAVSMYPSSTLVSPITKSVDSVTNYTVYSITLQFHQLYWQKQFTEIDRSVIDLDVPFSWYHQCGEIDWHIYCSHPYCTQARSYRDPSCPDTNNDKCYCHVTPVNPLTKECAIDELFYHNPSFYWTNGRYPLQQVPFYSRFISCAPVSLMYSLPSEVLGFASLSWTNLSLVTQLTPNYLPISRKFALCLPRTPRNSSGVMFIGVGPYYLNSSSDFDAESALSYAPLLKNPWLLGYYVGLNSIAINGTKIKIPETAFAIDELGQSGVKLSVVVPYTTMRSDIYRLFLRKYMKAMKGTRRAENLAPFGLCFRTNATKLDVPNIELKFSNGTTWTIDRSNSMVQVGSNLTCLAFVDGGETAEQAMVIGSYQMEDNFVMFDLVQLRFGFSSSLLPFGATCSNFNFMVGGVA